MLCIYFLKAYTRAAHVTSPAICSAYRSNKDGSGGVGAGADAGTGTTGTATFAEEIMSETVLQASGWPQL